MTLDLKPCPFCGVDLVRSDVLSGRKRDYWYHPEVAERCAAQNFFCSTPNSIEAWNRRFEATAPSGQAPLEGVKTLDLSNLLKHAFISGRESVSGPGSFNAEAWVEYDPEVCPAYHRICAALLPARAEPVAWRTRGMNCASEWVVWQMVNADAAERWKRDPSFKNGRREVEPLYAAPPASAEPDGDLLDQAVAFAEMWGTEQNWPHVRDAYVAAIMRERASLPQSSAPDRGEG